MKRKVLKTLPVRTYSALYRLSTLVKSHGWTSYDKFVQAEIWRIVEESPAKDDFNGWTDKKISRWFFEHFFRVRANSTSSKKRKAELVEAGEKLARMEEESFQRLQVVQRMAMADILNQRMLLAQNVQDFERWRSTEQRRLNGTDCRPTQPEMIDPDSDAHVRANELEETKDHSSES